MPGSIRVLVLEAFDLPEAIADDEDVAIKVAVGTREFQTAPNRALGGKTTPWSLDFVFPVLNLRDNLVVMLLDKDGKIISKNEIDTPSIVEKGSFEVDLLLNGGGNIHLSLSFVLTDEERRKIDIMRAAALKRREQEALKSAANIEPVEKESESGPSEPYSTPVGELEKEIENSEGSKESPSVALEGSDEPQSIESEGSLQGTNREPSISFEPVGELDSTGQDLSEKPSDGGSVRPQHHAIFNETLADQINTNLSSTPEIPSQACIHNELDVQTASGSLDDSAEVNHVTPSPNSVKAKIKAFETTKPKGAIKQGSYTLPSTVEVHVSSPQIKGSPRRNVESEAEQVASPKAHLDHMAVNSAGEEKLDTANQMGSVEPFKSVSEGDEAVSRASGAEHYEKEKDERQVQGTESIVEPIPNVDRVVSNERDMQREKTLVAAPKQKRRTADLMGVSKQVLHGAIVGAISGAVLIAAGALLWARDPNKRRNTSARQISKQERRK